MKQKIFTFIFFILFICTFGYFYGHEYKDFYQEIQVYQEEVQIVKEELEQFSLDDITDVSDVSFYVTPDETVLDMMVQKILSAQEKVYLEVYIFTEKRIFEALKKAHTKWVDVRVVLEKNPYLAWWINNSRFSDIETFGIPIVWSNSQLLPLNHAKFLIIDDEVILSTGNMSYSTFTKNRDFFISIWDQAIVSVFQEIFEADFYWKQRLPYHPNILLSPEYSREKLYSLIDSAQESIEMYFQYLKDDELLDKIIEKSQSGIEIEILLDDDYFDESPEEIDYLESQWISVKKYKNSTMHAKAILVDDTTLFIGSINFSTYSIDSNREVGIFLQNQEIIEEFLSVFEEDFHYGKVK